ncbi:MAG: hypothetical protein V3V61_02335, partial [Gammaproteobacteria bacterium]
GSDDDYTPRDEYEGPMFLASIEQLQFGYNIMSDGAGLMSVAIIRDDLDATYVVGSLTRSVVMLA